MEEVGCPRAGYPQSHQPHKPPSFGNSFSGALASPSANGLLPATMTGQVFDFSPFAVDFYVIDHGHGFFVETDLLNPNAPSGVASFGYYAARTPQCPACPWPASSEINSGVIFP
jgi:hypothetical protein